MGLAPLVIGKHSHNFVIKSVSSTLPQPDFAAPQAQTVRYNGNNNKIYYNIAKA